MPRDTLDADLLVVVEELERAAVTVRTLKESWPWLARCGVKAEVLVAELQAAALRGRHAVTAKANADYAWREAEAHGVDVAEACVGLQKAARVTLRALEALGGESVGDEVAGLREELGLFKPRLRGALDQTRRVCDALARADQVVSVHPAGKDLSVRFTALRSRLEAAYAARDAAVRARRAANRGHKSTRRELVALLRRLRVTWEAAWTWSEGTIPRLAFELAAADLAACEARRAARAVERADCAP